MMSSGKAVRAPKPSAGNGVVCVEVGNSCVLGTICTSFETFSGEIEGFLSGDGSVLRQIERQDLSKVR